MKRRVLAVIAATFFSTPVLAQDAISDHLGMLGLGYFTSDAPIGFRYWTSSSLGFDGGIGFRSETDQPLQENGSGTSTTLVGFGVEGGLLFVLNSEDNMILFFRPGIGFTSRQEIVPDTSEGADPGDEVKRSRKRFTLSAMIGAELFLSRLGFPNLSLGGGTGVSFVNETPPEQGAASRTEIATILAEVNVVAATNLGFHFYFF